MGALRSCSSHSSISRQLATQLATLYCASRVISSPSIVTVSRPAGDALKVTGYYRGVTPPISEAHKDDAAPARFSPDGSALYGDDVRCAPL